jgi:pyridoxine 5-phosphate synthase
MSVRLHVNIDHVATLRNARGTPYPDPVEAAMVCLAAGADGITAHLREDRRHIRDEDVVRLRRLPRVFNLEMAATAEMVAIARSVKPDVVTLVPERREERTTEGGLDVIGGGAALKAHVEALRGEGIAVSLFIAADHAQIEASKATGATQIELHTGDYAHVGPDVIGAGKADPAAIQRELARLAEGARHAKSVGLAVAAGHGLTRSNVGALMRVHEIEELNIGHALIGDAVFFSLAGAVQAMRQAIAAGRGA